MVVRSMRWTEYATLPIRLGAAVALAGVAGSLVGAELRDAGLAHTHRNVSLFSEAEAQTADGSAFRFVDDHARLSPSEPPDVAAPKFSRIVIEKSGLSRLEGDGTPGSQVLIKSEGVMIGAAVVDRSGNWAVSLDKRLESGDHAITSVAAGAETTQPGDEVRVFIPPGFSGREIVAYDRARDANPAESNQTGSVAPTTLQRAQELGRAASKRFSELEPAAPPHEPDQYQKKTQTRRGVDVVTPVAGWFERASQAYRAEVAAKLVEDVKKEVRTAENANQPPAKPDESATPPSDPLSNGAAAVRDWMKNANDTYDREVAKPLSIPVPQAGQEVAPAQAAKEGPSTKSAEPVLKAARPAVDASGTAAEAARKVQQEIFERQKAMRDAKAREEARAKASAEAQRQAEEAKRRQADDNAAKVRDAERAAAEASRKEAEAKKLADGMKRLEAAEKADAEKADAEEARKQAALQAKAAQAKPALKSEQFGRAETAETDQQKKPLEFKIVPLSRKEQRERADDDKRRAREAAAATAAAAAAEDDVPSSAERSEPSTRNERASSEPSVRREKPSASCRSHTKRDAHKRLIYVVQPGDTLWAIAHRHYRKGSRYPVIYRANQDRIVSPDIIRPCQKLVIPGRRRR